MPQSYGANSLGRNTVNLLMVLTIFIFVTACFFRSENERPTGNSESNQVNPKTSDNASSAVKNQTDSSGKKSDNGDFLVEHLEVRNSRYNDIDKQVKQEKLLEKAADKLNRNMMLPYNITLTTRDCGEINAFYNSEDHTVTVCYELMEHYYKIFKSTGMTSQDAYDKMFDAVRFAFLHELGHALIDAYKLPVIGNEEDAADRCSSYICLTELGEEGLRSVMAAADGFEIESKLSKPNSRSLADEHLLQEQRFYNTLCMIYGSDPKSYDYLIKEDYLPKERAVRCRGEFEKTVQSWSSLFEPWRKE